MAKKYSNLTYNQKLLTYSTIISLILAIITGIYAYSTIKTVNIMHDDFIISDRPYLSVRSMDPRIDNQSLVYSYTLANSGKLPAIITKTTIIAMDTYRNEKLLNNNTAITILNPGESIAADLIKINHDSIDKTFKINLTMTYHSSFLGDNNYILTYLYNYHGNPNRPLTINGSYVN